MEKLIAMVICTILVVALVGCSTSKDGNYPATIMVNGTNFYSTNNAVAVEVDDSVIQYTTSYAENGVPKRMEKQILIKIPERHTQFLKMVW